MSSDTILLGTDTHSTGVLKDDSVQEIHNNQIAIKAGGVPSSHKQTLDAIHHDFPPGPDWIYPHPLTSDGRQHEVIKQQEKPRSGEHSDKTFRTDTEKAPVMPKPGSPPKEAIQAKTWEESRYSSWKWWPTEVIANIFCFTWKEKLRPSRFPQPFKAGTKLGESRSYREIWEPQPPTAPAANSGNIT